MTFLLTEKTFDKNYFKLVLSTKAIGRFRLRYKYLERWPKFCTVSEILGKTTTIYLKISAITLILTLKKDQTQQNKTNKTQQNGNNKKTISNLKLLDTRAFVQVHLINPTCNKK